MEDWKPHNNAVCPDCGHVEPLDTKWSSTDCRICGAHCEVPSVEAQALDHIAHLEQHCKELQNGKKEALDHAAELEQQLRWRDVTEELPDIDNSERSKSVLVWCDSDEALLAQLWIDGVWADSDHGGKVENVTHWKPITAPGGGMMENKFIYIFEDGAITQGPEPSEGDLSASDDGYLSIINAETMQEYHLGKWSDIESVTKYIT